MFKPDKILVSELKKYDKNLSLKWNYESNYWEVWYRHPTGKKLVTPVVESIYREGGACNKFHPLGLYLIDWLWSADSWKKSKRWRWLSRKKYQERIAKRNLKTRQLFKNFALDNYNLINQELINPQIAKTDWVRPEMTGRNRIMYRKKYYDYSRSN